jgi:hypothetical protein
VRSGLASLLVKGREKLAKRVATAIATTEH